jgi:hypothetical protein
VALPDVISMWPASQPVPVRHHKQFPGGAGGDMIRA